MASSSNTSDINVIQEMTDYYQSFVDLFAKGVDFELAGNGGPECYDYLSETQRIYETFLGLTIIVLALGLGQKLHVSKSVQSKSWTPSIIRRILSVSMSFCIGMEFTYKLCTQQLLFIINPCHCLCFLQILILNLNPFTVIRPKSETLQCIVLATNMVIDCSTAPEGPIFLVNLITTFIKNSTP